MKDARVGLKWSKLEVIETGWREKWQFDEIDPKTGRRTTGGVKDVFDTAKLKCVCGEVFEMDIEDIDKRIHTACEKCRQQESAAVASGQVAPRTGLPGRPLQGRFRKVQISITVPLDIVNWIEGVADQKRMSVSNLVVTMLDEKMKAEKGEWA